MSRRYIEIDLNMVKRDYVDNNMSLREMEKKYGVSYGTLYKRIQELGIKNVVTKVVVN